MNGSITLHPTLGVNPKLTFCPRCGGDGDELMLIGAHTGIVKCDDCGLVEYGGRAGMPCPKCRHTGRTRTGTIGEHDKLPGTSPCRKCEAEMEQHKQIVSKGGVYFKCKACKAEGVVKAGTGLANAVREKSGIAAPNPVGIEFDACEQHTPKEEPQS